MKIYKKWLLYSYIAITLVVCCITVFNYKVDSLGIFGNSNFLLKAANSLTNGNMIAGLKNYDDRRLQELTIKNLKVKNDVIAIGSSRTMMLRKRFLPDSNINFFNHSVSGASLEDYISIVGSYEYIKGYIPSTVIFGIDPWIFNRHNDQSRWKTLKKYYNYEMNKINKKNQPKENTLNLTKWKQLINYSYTYSNLNFFISMLKYKDKMSYITNTIKVDDFIKEPDGSIHYPYKDRYANENIVKQRAIKYTKGNVYGLENFNKLDNIKLFENFINYLQSKKIKIIFLLPPYNPIAYDIVSKNTKYKNLLLAEKYLKNFASQNKIQLIGSYNPHKFNFTNKDFLDGMHGKEIVLKELVRNIEK